MSDYCLTISIKTCDRNLLDDLVVTLESVNTSLDGIKDVEVLLFDDKQAGFAQLYADKLRIEQPLNKTDVLERWMLDDQ